MDLIRAVQRRAEPHPRIYRGLLALYGLCGEVYYFFHALISGKFAARLSTSRWLKALSRQSIPYRDLGADIRSVEALRTWLHEQGVRFVEGGWTIYLPPQERMSRCFPFLQEAYPPDAGLKILKDLRGPETARYTPHRQSPAPGAAILRSLTPSPVGLIRIANYLYRCGVGIRIYDIIGLRGGGCTLTGYVVEAAGGGVKEKHYERFMEEMRSVLSQRILTTGHARVATMEDLMPPDCNGNLRVRSSDTGSEPVFVDFQGFLFRDEDRMIEQAMSDAKPHVPFDLEETGRGQDTAWRRYEGMFEEAGCRLKDRLVMEIGCRRAFVAYEALSAGATWVVGWYAPSARAHVERLLLALGATRFDAFELDERRGEAGLMRELPGRYRGAREGVLFLPQGAAAFSKATLALLPWEYAVSSGPGEVPGGEPVAETSWIEADGTKHQACLFRRTGGGVKPAGE